MKFERTSQRIFSVKIVILQKKTWLLPELKNNSVRGIKKPSFKAQKLLHCQELARLSECKYLLP